MRKTAISISEVIKGRTEDKKVEISEGDFEVEIEGIEPVSVEIPVPCADVVAVNISSVQTEAIELPAINDEHGRISDIITALEDETGMSVIPLEMGHIAPEVQSLREHSIFENSGKRFAMSHRIREDVIDSWQERIIKSLSAGIPFEEVLNIVVTYRGYEYETLALSVDEWTLLMAKFRKYKERLTRTPSGEFCLHVYAERAD